MSLDHLSALSGRVRGSDPQDRAAQARNLDLLCEVSAFVQKSASPEVAACLLAAAHALQALAGADAALPRAEVHGSASALLAVVLRALTPAPAAPQAVQLAPAKPAAPGPAASAAPASAALEAAAQQEREARLGRMLLRLGYITRTQLARALRLHRGKGLPVGECLLLIGACAPELVLETMKLQAEVRAKGKAGKAPRPAPAAPAQRRPTAAFHVTKDMFLGEVLLGVGMVTIADLEQAMHLHHHLGLRVGEALVKIGALTAQEVERGLELQRHLQSIATVKARR